MEHHCQKITPALDRFQEAHYWIHMLEAHYHRADLFRWHLNAFLRALKEISDIFNMDAQRDQALLAWFKQHKEVLKADPLLRRLSKKRDYVVHQSRLIPNSGGHVGISDMRCVKLGVAFPIHPLEDSDAAMKRFLLHVRVHGDAFGILELDDDTMPCIYRQWKLPEFDDEIIAVCVSAWLRVGRFLGDALSFLGEENDGFNLDCRHDKHKYTVKMYDRQQLIENVEHDGGGWLNEKHIWIPTGERISQRQTKSLEQLTVAWF